MVEYRRSYRERAANNSLLQVTTDPESTRNPIQEGVGTVTSDSLAAESLKGEGEFGKGNPKAAASQQPSSSTTTNTTDTSSATKLDAAVDAHAREAKDGWSEEGQLKGAKGLGKESGVGPTYNDVGSGVNSSGQTRATTTGTSDGTSIQGNIAPEAAYAHTDLAGGKPKGKDITEDPDLKGKTVFGAAGTDKDPARQAELDFAKQDAAPSGVSHGDLAEGGDSKYSALDSERHT